MQANQQLPPYALLSPVGYSKMYIFEKFVLHIANLRPKPALYVFAADIEYAHIVEEIARKYLNNVVVLKVYSDLYDEVNYSDLLRIARARELLRKYALSTPYNWFLWVDSDILIPHDLPAKLLDYAVRKNSLMLLHPYPGRNGKLWTGGGLMLTSRAALECGRFIVTRLRDINLSEDFNFIALVKACQEVARHLFGMGEVEEVKFDKVVHCIAPDKCIEG